MSNKFEVRRHWYCPRSVTRANLVLSGHLQQRFGFGLKVWKSVKAVTDLAALALVAYGISAGADPTISVIIGGAIVLGWEIVETIAYDEAFREALATKPLEDSPDE